MSGISIESLLVAAASLLLVSIVASRISGRLGVPALLLFLVIGMLAGSEGIGGIEFDDPFLAQLLAVMAFTLILYSGGFDTEISDIRPVWREGIILATFGVLVTCLILGGAVYLLLDLEPLEALLLGAIVSSTDAATVFAVLRSKSVGLRGNLKPLLELESGSNDPMAIFLTVSLIHLIQHPESSIIQLIPMFIQQMALGAILGVAMGYAIAWTINHLRLQYDGLYPVVTIAFALLAYGLTSAIGGNGFLAVYIAGLMSSKLNFIHKRSLKQFHDGIAWLCQIVLFLTLGLLVFPSELLQVTGRALLLSVALALVARPLAVFISIIWTKYSLREKTFISWVGLRGAAPIILATFPLLAGLEEADLMFNIVFFIVLTSVLIQGASLPIVARWLHVDAPLQQKRQYPLEFHPSEGLKSELLEVTVPKGSKVAGKRVLEVGFPEASLLVLLGRDNDFMIPSGSTTLLEDDHVLILADKTDADRIRELFGVDESGALDTAENFSI
jgi:cell volume regulation protein A